LKDSIGGVVDAAYKDAREMIKIASDSPIDGKEGQALKTLLTQAKAALQSGRRAHNRQNLLLGIEKKLKCRSGAKRVRTTLPLNYMVKWSPPSLSRNDLNKH